ncbi:hypothetical protein BpHYR1_010381 [Brachionus plicatilis]|uniref:Uncharacterized protein n=1 Tax=Brachionus plicatilis TaxID=10195 RepID=A0A3M7SVL6_BRAPC|nr:hypothetical protein BpHYR1_010381 [Brachionus plicatilis]
MRFESKHSYFKRVNEATSNHVNLTYSLTTKHQNLQLYHLISNDYFGSTMYGPQQKTNKDLLDFIKLITSDDKICLYNWAEINSIKFQIDDVLVTKIVNSVPTFSIIKSIGLSKNKIVFIIKDLQTIEYVNFKLGYSVCEAEILYSEIDYESIFSPFPLDLYDDAENQNQKFVIPKYPLI